MGETPPQSHHDWKFHGKIQNSDNCLWVCNRCRSHVQLLDDKFNPCTTLPPSYGSAMLPCDETIIKHVMES